jgi:hypothetical protein
MEISTKNSAKCTIFQRTSYNNFSSLMFWRFEFMCLPEQSMPAQPNPLRHSTVCYMYSGECTVLANFFKVQKEEWPEETMVGGKRLRSVNLDSFAILSESRGLGLSAIYSYPKQNRTVLMSWMFFSFRVIDSRVHLLLVGNFTQSGEDVRRQTT